MHQYTASLPSDRSVYAATSQRGWLPNDSSSWPSLTGLESREVQLRQQTDWSQEECDEELYGYEQSDSHCGKLIGRQQRRGV